MHGSFVREGIAVQTSIFALGMYSLSILAAMSLCQSILCEKVLGLGACAGVVFVCIACQIFTQEMWYVQNYTPFGRGVHLFLFFSAPGHCAQQGCAMAWRMFRGVFREPVSRVR